MRTVPIDFEYLGEDWWEQLVVVDGDHWLFTGSVNSDGYGKTWDGSRTVLAHRVAWTLDAGVQIPDGLTVDHRCHVLLCCNPEHLQLLANVDNARKNLQGVKTHCPSGHPYDGENLFVDRRGHRRCRACARARRRDVTQG